MNGINRKFFSYSDHEKNFLFLQKCEKFSSFAENLLKITNLEVTERAISTYFVRLYIQLQTIKDCYYQSNHAIETILSFLALKPCIFVTK